MYYIVNKNHVYFEMDPAISVSTVKLEEGGCTFLGNEKEMYRHAGVRNADEMEEHEDQRYIGYNENSEIVCNSNKGSVVLEENLEDSIIRYNV